MTNIAFKLSEDGEVESTLFLDGEASEYEDRAGFTTVAPPAKPWPARTGYVFRSGAWVQVPDYRYLTFHDPATGDELQIFKVAVEPPPGYVEGPSLRSAELRDRLRLRVKAELAKRFDAPVSCAGTLIDADAQARENIQGLITRIERGDGLTPGWTGWRTYDNGMVWAGWTAEQVLEGLYAVSRAIEDRKQALYQAKWTHDEAIETLADLTGYDVTAGWPA